VRKVRFRQADVQRAVRGVTSAGVAISRIEVDLATGKVVITPRDGDGGSSGSPLDDWLAKNARAS
jgi:hypothetical protein